MAAGEGYGAEDGKAVEEEDESAAVKNDAELAADSMLGSRLGSQSSFASASTFEFRCEGRLEWNSWL